MTPRPSGPRPLPSDAELGLLRELWKHGEQGVRELHERVSRERDVGYTTVLKLLQRMHGKGLVERRREGRAHVYRAVVSEESTERRVVRDFIERTFDGSAARLILRALPREGSTEEALEGMRRELERLEGEG